MSTWPLTPGTVQVKRLKKWEKILDTLMPRSMRLDEYLGAANQALLDYGTSVIREETDEDSLNTAISTYNHIITWQSGSIEQSKGYKEAPTVLHKLGEALRERYILRGDLDDLNSSIKWLREATNPAYKETRLSQPWQRFDDLATSLQLRYKDQRIADPDDLSEAISSMKSCLRLCPTGHLHYGSCLGHLAEYYQLRFMRRGDKTDSDKALKYYQKELDLLSRQNPWIHIVASNYSTALSSRFERFQEAGTLDKSIALARDSVSLSQERYDKSDIPVILYNLARKLWQRYLLNESTSSDADLKESEALYRESIGLLSSRASEDSRETITLVHYGLSLLLRELWDTDRTSAFCTDIREAVVYHIGEASKFTTKERRSLHLQRLGQATAELYGEERWREAVEIFRKAATDPEGSVLDWYHSARWWGEVSGRFAHPELALEGFKLSVSFLPQVASLSGTNSQRYKNLVSYAGESACDAAATALQLDQPELAVELFEQGRAVFWQLALQLRTDFSDIREVNKDLYDELVSVAESLESSQEFDTSLAGSLPLHAQIGGEEALSLQRRRLVEKWNHLVRSTRKIAGKEHFLLPTPFKHLRRAATRGYVVLVNISAFRSDALIITASEPVRVVPLPTETYNVCTEISTSLQKSTGLRARYVRSGTDRLNIGKPKAVKNDEDLLNHALRLLWDYVVSFVVNALQLQPCAVDLLPRIWWCSSGTLAALPLHAALSAGGKPAHMMDFAVSSYTPDIRTLLRAAERSMHKSDIPYRVLAISQPNTPTSASLNTAGEMKVLTDMVPSEHLEILEGPQATVERTLAALQKAHWTHWACHGKQSLQDPLSSAMILHDGHLPLSSLISHPLENAQFALLSACQTATGDRDAPNESMHLTAGMLFSGYRGVVGTLWSIWDQDAPHIAKNVYEGMRQQKGGFDVEKAALALHKAVVKLRAEKGVTAERWVPFIHMGW